MCDAVVLIYLERSRPPAKQSADWVARQWRKVEAGVAEAAELLGQREWLVGDSIGLADVTVGCMLDYLDLRLPDFEWRSRYPSLVRFAAKLAERPSFQATRPEPQTIVPPG